MQTSVDFRPIDTTDRLCYSGLDLIFTLCVSVMHLDKTLKTFVLYFFRDGNMQWFYDVFNRKVQKGVLRMNRGFSLKENIEL